MEQLKITCFYPGERPQTVVIPIDTDALVTELLEKIHGRLKQRDRNFDVDECDLSLYKTDLPLEPDEDKSDRARQWINSHADQQLRETQIIATLFPQQPGFAFHIVVADPERERLFSCHRAHNRAALAFMFA
ncbi:hypothetical protein NLJ89_g501 [Agrocybe chaxingu]|uniref:Crinkler effector protein N-terminal domain-containing protein n=1 Tax=Agrocybe chaxingu TaxID=84603 RepID=A0A9W8N1U8_9AGAR|nr:hypothetical protein NLJ89_g501 [Agrocybe chaxingu]